MVYQNIINHTRANLTFVIGNRTYEIGSKGSFNLNHDYDYLTDNTTLRIVEDPTVLNFAKAMGYTNFISLENLIIESYSLVLISDVASKIYITSGMGGIVRVCQLMSDVKERVDFMFASARLHILSPDVIDTCYECNVDMLEFNIITHSTFKDYV